MRGVWVEDEGVNDIFLNSPVGADGDPLLSPDIMAKHVASLATRVQAKILEDTALKAYMKSANPPSPPELSAGTLQSLQERVTLLREQIRREVEEGLS